MTKHPIHRYIHIRPKKNPSLKDLYNVIQKDLDKTEEKLKSFTDSSNEIISEINTYLFQNTGKRIRPALLMLCSKLLGYKGDKHIFLSSLIETLHTASLIHDDIIDNSELRRGRKTVHTKWGPNITVLLGDYLYVKTLGLSIKNTHREIAQILIDTSAKMIEGELYEYQMSGKLDIKEKDYLEVIRKKTASLFAASCQIGSILAGASEKEKKLLARFGTNFGMSFQIIDDLLDYTGDEKTLGKPILSDLNERRITLPLIYTLNNRTSDRTRITELMSQKNLDKESKIEILDLIKSNGALDYTRKKAEEFSLKSKKIMTGFSESKYRDTLFSILDFIVNRNR